MGGELEAWLLGMRAGRGACGWGRTRCVGGVGVVYIPVPELSDGVGGSPLLQAMEQ